MKVSRILLERTFDIDAAVDYIYDKAFAYVIDSIANNSWDGEDGYDMQTIPSEDLPGDVIEKANKIKPITIHATDNGDNQYVPSRDQIYVSINPEVLNLIRREGVDGARKLIQANNPLLLRAFENEMNGRKVRGSIHHEISHWLDDTLHNSHIEKTVNKAADEGPKRRGEIMRQKNPNVGMTNYEMNAQIHAIKELKRHYDDETWNRFSFENMIDHEGSLLNVGKDIRNAGKQYYNKWKQSLLRRMNRENLLGKNMKGS